MPAGNHYLKLVNAYESTGKKSGKYPEPRETDFMKKLAQLSKAHEEAMTEPGYNSADSPERRALRLHIGHAKHFDLVDMAAKKLQGEVVEKGKIEKSFLEHHRLRQQCRGEFPDETFPGRECDPDPLPPGDRFA